MRAKAEGGNSVALFYHPASLEHFTGAHPESPERLRAILSALQQHDIPDSDLLLPEPVSIDLLSEVHDPRYISLIERIAGQGGGLWDLDTYISPGSYKAGIMGAGAAVAAVDSVMSGKRSAFALIRPPGHHALYASAMGFCLFNNVAVAAQHAIRSYGLERVLIVDWDVHHGNGTQDFFYARPDVLFFSTHRYPFYPGTGSLTEVGDGSGRGYTCNVPLPAGVGDSGHNLLFDRVLAPLARRFKPQLILISAGYDSHIKDPLGGMAVTVAGFSQLARSVRLLADEIDECGGRVAAILEGGYNVEALAESVVATIGALGAVRTAGVKVPETRPSLDPGSRSPCYREPDVRPLIARIKQLHNLPD